MAETTCLLNMRTLKGVPGVRIPPSPHRPKTHHAKRGGFFYIKKFQEACFIEIFCTKKPGSTKETRGFLSGAGPHLGITSVIPFFVPGIKYNVLSIKFFVPGIKYNVLIIMHCLGHWALLSSPESRQ